MKASKQDAAAQERKNEGEFKGLVERCKLEIGADVMHRTTRTKSQQTYVFSERQRKDIKSNKGTSNRQVPMLSV